MKVFLIDDDEEDQEIFEMAVSETGLKVNLSCFTNGEAGIEKLKIESPTPEFVFIDLNMPRIDGFECLQRIYGQNLDKYSRLIVYSTSSNDRDIKKAMLMGAHEYLVKPVNFGQLVSSLKTLLER